MQKIQFTVSSEYSGSRIDKLAPLLKITRGLLQKMIKTGNVSVNGDIITDINYKIKTNDELNIKLITETETKLLPAKMDLNIVFEDRYLIVLNKPAGLTVHPGAGNYQDTLANALIAHTASLSEIAGQTRPGIVHRLDKDTSGLMVVAKNDIVHAGLAKLIETKAVTRTYKALVWGLLKPLSGTIKTQIGKSRSDHTKMQVIKSGGKTAITHYKTEKVYLGGSLSLVECTLETGRTHQIRVHLSNSGHSVVGDQVYGSNKKKISTLPTNLQESFQELKRQALHSSFISFTHPITGKLLEFNSDLPDDILKVVRLLT